MTKVISAFNGLMEICTVELLKLDMIAVLQILNFDKQTSFQKVIQLLKDRVGITEVRLEELTGRIILNTKSFNSLEGAKYTLLNSGIEIVEVNKKTSSRQTNKKS